MSYYYVEYFLALHCFFIEKGRLFMATNFGGTRDLVMLYTSWPVLDRTKTKCVLCSIIHVPFGEI